MSIMIIMNWRPHIIKPSISGFKFLNLSGAVSCHIVTKSLDRSLCLCLLFSVLWSCAWWYEKKGKKKRNPGRAEDYEGFRWNSIAGVLPRVGPAESIVIVRSFLFLAPPFISFVKNKCLFTFHIHCLVYLHCMSHGPDVETWMIWLWLWKISTH